MCAAAMSPGFMLNTVQIGESAAGGKFLHVPVNIFSVINI